MSHGYGSWLSDSGTALELGTVFYCTDVEDQPSINICNSEFL